MQRTSLPVIAQVQRRRLMTVAVIDQAGCDNYIKSMIFEVSDKLVMHKKDYQEFSC